VTRAYLRLTRSHSLFSQGLTQQKVAVESAEAAWQKAQTALGAAAEQKNSLGMQLQSTTRQVEVLTLKLAELTADGKQVAARQAELEQISMSWAAAKAGLQEIEKALAAFGGDPRDEVARLEKQLHAADDAAAKALAEESREEGRLENLSVQGPYSALARAEEEVVRLQRDLEAEELRVAAIKLLRDTVTQCRAEALASVAAPVEATATRILQRIAGERRHRFRSPRPRDGHSRRSCPALAGARSDLPSRALSRTGGGELYRSRGDRAAKC